MSVGILHAMLRDEDPRVVARGPRALSPRRAARTRSTPRSATSSTPTWACAWRPPRPSPSSRRRDCPSRSLAAWRRGLGDGDGELEARLAAVAALAAQKDDAARAGLAEVARRDPSRAVRARAATLLARAGGEADRPRPAAGRARRRSTTARRWRPTTRAPACRSTRRAPS